MEQNDIKIPNHFYIGGQRVDVMIGDDPCLRQDLGLCRLANGTIHIADTQTPDSKMNTFVHELLHAALDTIGRYSESNDEQFVCSLAGALTEAIRTMEYGESIKENDTRNYTQNTTI